MLGVYVLFIVPVICFGVCPMLNYYLYEVPEFLNPFNGKIVNI